MRICPSYHAWRTGTPRRWQLQALPRLIGYLRRHERPRGLVRAIMGAGKSILLSELIRLVKLKDNEIILVTAPTQALVQQLAAEIRQWGGTDDVGLWYQHQRQLEVDLWSSGRRHNRVVVACHDSLTLLVDELERLGLRVPIWFADEAHRSEQAALLDAHERLQPHAVMGLSATPWRVSGKFTLFDDLVVDYGPGPALQDGVIVPWRIVRWDRPGYHLDDACVAMIGTAEGPGVANAITCDDCDDFAAKLTEAGIPAEPIHSRVNKAARSERLARLKSGELKAVVHANMLAEGVNLPWLRWLCLRRTGATPIRFCQEVGRVLRSHPGKTEAVLFDPNDLFDYLDLDYEAVLSGGQTKAEDGDAASEVKRRVEAAKEEGGPLDEVYAAVKRPVNAYLRDLIGAWRLMGVSKPSPMQSKSWRYEQATETQANAIRKLAWARGAFAPKGTSHRELLKAVIELGPALNRGAASDLIDILMTLAERRAWADPQGDLESQANEAKEAMAG